MPSIELAIPDPPSLLEGTNILVGKVPFFKTYFFEFALGTKLMVALSIE